MISREINFEPPISLDEKLKRRNPTFSFADIQSAYTMAVWASRKRRVKNARSKQAPLSKTYSLDEVW